MSILKTCLLALATAVVPSIGVADDHAAATYRKLSLETKFFSEGSAFGDLNNDGNLDAISGPYWWEGPDFKKRHEFYPALPFDPLSYSDNFLAFTHDFNGDGWNDILILGFPAFDASWYANPGPNGKVWRRKAVYMPVENESPTFGHFFGKDKPPVIICMSRGVLGYVTWEPRDQTLPWVFHPVSPNMGWHRYTHGLGWGDINGDGRNDILERDGWWEQPESLQGDPVWTQHKYSFGGAKPKLGGSQMHVYDVNNDGKGDVIASLNGHGFGLSWFEQTRSAGGEIDFKEHPILSSEENEKLGGVQFSQLHAVEVLDVDGDGVKDIVTGKRWWAHGPKGDPQPNAAPVVYAFLLKRGADGSVSYVPQLIDDTTGVGVQLGAADVNRDGVADVIVGNKRGTAVLLSRKKAGRK